MTAPAVPPDATAVKKSGGKERSSSNVRVVGRIRPLAEYEKEKGCEEVLRCLPSDPVTGNGASEVIQIEGKDKRWFELDAVFDGNSTQDEVYIKSGAKQAVTEDIFQGFNCTILAYGQTGAGKIAVGGVEILRHGRFQGGKFVLTDTTGRETKRGWNIEHSAARLTGLRGHNAPLAVFFGNLQIFRSQSVHGTPVHEILVVARSQRLCVDLCGGREELCTCVATSTAGTRTRSRSSSRKENLKGSCCGSKQPKRGEVDTAETGHLVV